MTKHEDLEKHTMSQEVWIYLETAEGDLTPSTRELITKGRELADQLGVELAGLIVGGSGDSLTQLAWSYGLPRAYVVADPLLEFYTNEAYVAAATTLIEAHRPQLLLTGTSLQMRDFTASLAAAVDAAL